MDLRIAAAERRNTLIVVAAMAAMFFIWMPGEFLAGDPYSWREEARSILQSGELHVTEQVVPLFGEPGQYLVRNPRNGLHYSKYGIANSLLAVPPLLVQRALYGALPPPGGAPSLLIFNLWQIGYGALLAAILYALSGRYSRRAGVRAVFIVAAFFCTSLWFYQRAQSSEIYQTILFTALFIALTRFLRPLLENGPRGVTPRDWLCLAAAWACAAVLVLTRASYGLLLPVVVLLGAGCALRGRPWRELLERRLLAALLVPPALIVALFGWVNYAKFGAPWLTGYHAWRTDLVTPTLRLVDGLWGYLFSIRFSMFVSFPLLVFALAGARRFTERHRLDAIAAAALFVPTLLLLSSLPSWAGEWSYGPRYLLPMLPVLALPFLVFADEQLDRIGAWPARAWVAAGFVVLAYAAYQQSQMSRAPFWIYYHARGALDGVRSPESIDYFYSRNDAVIAGELMAHRKDLSALAYYAELKRLAPPEPVKQYTDIIEGMLERGNLYWSLPAAERR